mgnify:CR=1 FL=1
MRKITAIPSKKIAFKNVPILGLFFLKRTLYQKISLREARIYKNEIEKVAFQSHDIVRFISKSHENIAIELIEDATKLEESDKSFEINDIVEIVKKSVLGKVVSVNKTSCFIQYKSNDVVCFNEFSKNDLRKTKLK